VAKCQLLANSSDAIGTAQVTVDPVQTEPALVSTAVEATGTTSTTGKLQDRAEGHDGELPLQFGIANAEPEQLGHGRRTQAVGIQSIEHGLHTHVLAEVLEKDFGLVHLVRLEVVVVDAVVGPVVVTLPYQLIDALAEDVQRADITGVGDQQLGDLLTQLAILEDRPHVVVVTTQEVDLLGDQLDHLEGRAQGTHELTLLTSHGFLSFFRYTSYLYTM